MNTSAPAPVAPRPHRRLALRLGLLLSVIPLVLLGCQHRLIYHPQPIPDYLRREAEPLPYTTAQGRQVAWYVAPRRGGVPARLWLCFGGNASLGLFWLDQVRSAPRDDDAFLLIDYPSYGDCEGTPSPERIRVSMNTAWTTLTARWSQAVPTAILAHSLGCAPGLQFASDHPCERVVLIAPFTSMIDMARGVVGWPLCHLLLHRFDNRATLATVLAHTPRPPVVILHGTQDEVIPVRMGRELGAQPGVTFQEFPSSDHNGVADDAAAALQAAMK